MTKRKVGLALSRGAARGAAHIGILEILEKEGISIDMIAGTSAGAVAGALYAQRLNASRIKQQALELNWKRLAPLVDLSLPKTGFIKGKKIKDLLISSFGGDVKFRDLRIPFACVATDIESGEEVVIDSGSVPEAVRASISIPAIFTVVSRGGRYLVDGSLVNPVPVSVVKRIGADFVIAINVIPDVAEHAHRINKEREEGVKEPNIIHILMQSTYIGTYALGRASLEEADIVIEPQTAHIGASEFHHAQEGILQGELAAQAAIPEIKRLLATRHP
ncbi:patatin-like phospholipase family protein [Chloroflexota bacterium]